MYHSWKLDPPVLEVQSGIIKIKMSVTFPRIFQNNSFDTCKVEDPNMLQISLINTEEICFHDFLKVKQFEANCMHNCILKFVCLESRE